MVFLGGILEIKSVGNKFNVEEVDSNHLNNYNGNDNATNDNKNHLI